MHRGLTIILGGLLEIPLSVGAIFAGAPPCPTTPSTLPRLFLQTDHLKTFAPSEFADSSDGPKDYVLDASLIRGAPVSDASQADHSAVELATEKDLAALRIKTDGAVTPYVGAGVTAVPEVDATPGISKFEAERESERQAYLLGAGLACDLSHSARLNLGYRYAAGNLPELSGSKPTATETDRDDHHISFGLKLDF
jgi:hypothetical protein